MPRIYPPDFRRKVLDLLAAGRKFADLAAELDLSDQTIYNWRLQHLIDTAQARDHELRSCQLVAVRRRIAELAVEPAATLGANELRFDLCCHLMRTRQRLRRTIRHPLVVTIRHEHPGWGQRTIQHQLGQEGVGSTCEHGALANPGGRPRRINAA